MSSLNVLVVEDDIGLGTIYERVLLKMGCEVTLARDGHYAIQLLHTMIPDLIFLDMYLPLLNGIAVLEFIATRPALASVNIIIASSSKEYEQYATMVANAQFILKPILPTQIRDIAQLMMQSHHG